MPGRMDAADKIKRSIEVVGQVDSDFPFPQSELVVGRFGIRDGLGHGRRFAQAQARPLALRLDACSSLAHRRFGIWPTSSCQNRINRIKISLYLIST